jgi:hypothetical protein
MFHDALSFGFSSQCLEVYENEVLKLAAIFQSEPASQVQLPTLFKA